MKQKAKIWLLLSIVFIMLSSLNGININAGGTVSENFTIGTSATATLPTDWRVTKDAANVRTVGSYAAGTTATEQRAGNSMSSTAANGVYNYAAGDPTTATERAVGFISSSSATKSGNLYVKLYNSGSGQIPNFTISYNVEKYRMGTNAAGFSIQMYYSTDGSSWTNAGSNFLTSFAGGDASNNGYATAPGATSAVSNKLLSVALDAGNNLYLAWNYSVTSGTTTSNAQALGIDDVSIVAGAGANVAPVITNIVKNPSSGYLSTTTVSVSADITDSDGTVEVAELRWGTSTGIYPNTINMSLDSGDTYAADSDIPAQADLATVYFIIYAKDDDNDFSTSTEQSYYINDPKIIVTGALTAFSAIVGYPSAYQSYNVQGNLLTGNIGIQAPTGYELSTAAGGPYTSTLDLPNTYNAAVYVRLTGASIGNFSGSIEHTSAGVSQVNKAVSGSVTAEPNLLFEENFAYTATTTVVSNGWTAHSGAGTNSPTVVSPGLTYTNYPSVSGNTSQMNGNGEDIHKTFVPRSSGIVYCSFLVDVTSSTEAGDYIFHFATAPIGSDFKGKFFVGRDASNNVRFGITKSANVGTAVAWTGYSYALNTTYLVVMKYVIVSGATNDEVYAWINPNFSGPEPTPQLQAVVSETDIAAIGSVAIRQSNDFLKAKIDGIRVATQWYKLFEQDVVPPGTTTTIGDVDIESEILLYYSSVPINDPGIPAIPNLANLVDPQAIIFTGTGTTDLIVTVGPGTWYVIAYYNGGWQTGTPYPITGPGTCSFFDIFLEGKGDVPVVISEGVDPTLPVELSSFTATFSAGFFVQLTWVVQSETNHMGYNIHRSNFASGESMVQINDSIIESGSSLGTQVTYTYRDEEVEPNSIYYYWLESIDLDGYAQMFGPRMVTVGNIDTPPPIQPVIIETALLDAYPNPFGSTTSIRYALKTSADVKLEIYNIKGQLVKTLENLPNKAAGTYQKVWDGNDLNGRPVSSGIYYYRMTSGKFTASKKVIVVK